MTDRAATRPMDRTTPETLSILFLGTGAADWPRDYPRVRFAKGEYRGNSSTVVNEHILIDCGPTVPEAANQFGVDAGELTDVLVTHTHADHFDAEAIGAILGSRPAETPLRIWAHPAALERVPEMDGLDRCPFAVGRTQKTGGTRVTALAANHVVEGSEEEAFHYLFETAGQRFLYATDGAWLLKPTWLRLKEGQLDAIIWDATNGETEGDWRIFEHNSIDMIRVMTQTLRKQNVLRPGSQIVLTHMARTLCAPHPELEERLRAEGIVPAYDGMRLRWPLPAEPPTQDV